jgi:serine/threonine protein phosphatase PrpC
MLDITSFGATDIGLRRSQNEDAYTVVPERGFLAVADGMGGAAAGEVASRIFIDTTLDVLSCSPATEQDAIVLVQDAFRRANEKIREYSTGDARFKNMGCTAEVLTFHNEGFVLGHVGDSRTYLHRKGKLRQLTRDHSLVQEQLEQGLLAPDQARRHSLRNVIFRAVGQSESLAVDLIRGRGLSNDIFLLCTDGLHDMVDDEIIRDILAVQEGIPAKTAKLIEAARSAGGYDNITVVVCEVLSRKEE